MDSLRIMQCVRSPGWSVSTVYILSYVLIHYTYIIHSNINSKFKQNVNSKNLKKIIFFISNVIQNGINRRVIFLPSTANKYPITAREYG